MNENDINPPPRRRGNDGASPDPNGTEGKPRPEASIPDKEDEDEKVGYCNPPKHRRFTKGQSGNPAGRKKGERSLRKLIDMELDVKLEVTERGKKRNKTKREIAATRVVNKAVEGDDKALTFLLKHDGAVPADINSTAASISSAPLTEGEESILEYFMAAARTAVERDQLAAPGQATR